MEQRACRVQDAEEKGSITHVGGYVLMYIVLYYMLFL